VAHCHHGLGRLYGQTGRGAEARVALTAAIDLYRTMEMSFWLPQAEAALAQVGMAAARARGKGLSSLKRLDEAQSSGGDHG
jgi:hypothetical protein